MGFDECWRTACEAGWSEAYGTFRRLREEELGRLTMAQLREVARAEHVCLGYSGSSKDATVLEIVEWELLEAMRWKTRRKEVARALRHEADHRLVEGNRNLVEALFEVVFGVEEDVPDAERRRNYELLNELAELIWPEGMEG